MQKKKLLALVLSAAMAGTMLTGCGSKPADGSASNSSEESGKTAESGNSSADSSERDSGETAADHEEFVTLDFYISNSPVAEQDRIMEKANAIIKDKLNAELNLICIDGATYPDKINLMIGTGEEFDLCFMANWGGINYFENAAKGAFVDMTDMFPVYAPETYSRIPEALWDGVKVGGKTERNFRIERSWRKARRKFPFPPEVECL